MSNKDHVADALKYLICNIQGNMKYPTPPKCQGTFLSDDLMEIFSYKNGENKWSTPVVLMSDDEDDDFGTFNPFSKIDLSSITHSLNNISDEEVDKVRAAFDKNWKKCEGQPLGSYKLPCSHNMNKKWLLTSFYFKCDKCGFEED